MGLIKAALAAAGNTMADQWKEFFKCDAIDKDVIVVKGQKCTSRGSSNKYGSDNVITNGSGIVVADGQCMIIVEQGKVVEICAEPGNFTYDTSIAPSIFTGGLGEGIKNTFKEIGKRFTYGGDVAVDQRVYYFNTKELEGNKFGTATPIPFRVVDSRAGFDIDVSVRCNGTYSYRVADPLLFYTNVCGNVSKEYSRSELDTTLKTEFISALTQAMSKLSDLELRPNQLVAHTAELEDALNEVLSKKWGQLRGLKVVNVALGSVSLSPEDQALLKNAQANMMYTNAQFAQASRIQAENEAMKMAASNSAGAMTGFMGMGMMQQTTGANSGAGIQNLMAMQQAQEQAAAQQAASNSWKCSCGATATGNFCPQCGSKKPVPKAADSWTCKCGATATGKFCPECGSPKPAADGWTCKCGVVNKGKFCAECGSPKPAGEPLYKCDKCGWEPEDPKNPPRFCPECGDPFDENDRV